MAGVNITGLSKSYSIKGTPILTLADMDLTVTDGSFVTVVGKSGCGKSTLLRLICGLEPMTTGEIRFITEGRTHSRMESRINMIFQEPRLMPWLTVEENMAVGLLQETNPQRVALGRMLCYNPDVILMDEPLGALRCFRDMIGTIK